MQRAVAALLALTLAAIPVGSSLPTPGANGEVTEMIPVVGRLFPEPLMTNDYIGYFEAIPSLEKLNRTYPDLIEIIPIGHSYGWINRLTDVHETQPVHTIEVTNERSERGFEDKIHLVFTCSIHGNEKGGREGCLRVIEDFAKGIGMATDQRSAWLDHMVLSFTIPNVDGWVHDEPQYVANPGLGPFYTRENANGTDLNRQWPSLGYLEQTNNHRTMAEPEIAATATFLKDRYPNIWYAADIHGMLNPTDMDAPPVPLDCLDDASCASYPTEFQQFLAQEGNGHFLLGLLPSAQLTQDEFVRLTRVSELVRERTGQCPGTLGAAWCEAPALGPWGGNFNFWGTAWETIGYEATGSTRNYMISPFGLDAPSVTYEMSYNHIVCDGAYLGCGQPLNEFHVNTVRAIVGAFMEAASIDFRVSYETGGVRTAYVFNPLIVSTADDDGNPRASTGWSDQNARDDRWDILHNVYEASPNDYLRALAPHVRNADQPATFDEFAASALNDDTLSRYDQLIVAGSAVTTLEPDVVASIGRWLDNGGTLVLTDVALSLLADYTEIAPESIVPITAYAGHTEVIDKQHPMAQSLLGYSRQTFDPVGVGYPQGAAPIWVVGRTELEASGGVSVGVIGDGGPLQESRQVNLGQVDVGKGSIRFLGALLPDPTVEYYTPYGVGSYAVTYGGNQFFVNVLGFDTVFAAPPVVFETPGDLRRAQVPPPDNTSAEDAAANATGARGSADGAGLLLGVAAIVVALRRRR